MLETEIAIVGAGPAGLAAACEAAQKPNQVKVSDFSKRHKVNTKESKILRR